MNSKLSLLGLLGILLSMPAAAQTINPFPPIVPNSTEDSACYFKTTQGSILDLNGICGASQPKDLKNQNLSSSNNTQVITPSPLTPNREFRPIAGANPSNPFGRGPSGNNPNQCYIVNSDGDRCDANP